MPGAGLRVELGNCPGHLTARVDVGGAICGQEQERSSAPRPSQVPGQGQGRGAAAVQVVDRQQQRAVAGDAFEQLQRRREQFGPVVTQAPESVSGGLPGQGAERGAAKLLAQRPCPVAVEAAEGRDERRVGRLGGAFAAAVEDQPSFGVGGPGRLGDEAALSGAGLSCHQHRLVAAVRDPPPGGGQFRQLGVAADHRPGALACAEQRTRQGDRLARRGLGRTGHEPSGTRGQPET